MKHVTDFNDPEVAHQYGKQTLIYPSVGGPQFLELLGEVDGQRVLDLGCGNGQLTEELRQRGARAVGIDISSESLRAARELYPAVDFREMDGAHLKAFESGSFDKVVMFMVLLVVEDEATLKSIFAECRRVLKTAGELCFATAHPLMVRDFADGFRKVVLPPEGHYFVSGMTYQVQLMLSDLSSMEITDIHWTIEDLSRHLEENGFLISHLREPRVYPNNEHWQILKDALFTPHYLFVKARKMA